MWRIRGSIFFVLSGFVINLGYGNKFAVVEKKKYFIFMKKRLQKIYPLYFITMVIMFVEAIRNVSTFEDTIRNCVLFLLSIFMLQTLVPIQSIAQVFNGAAWFMSCLFVLYLCTPYLLKWNEKIRNNIKSTLLCGVGVIGIYEILILFVVPLVDEKYRIGLVYCSPYMRSFYCVFGILLGNIYIILKDKINNCSVDKRIIATCLEVISVISFIFTYIIVPNLEMKWSYLVFMLVSGMIIIIFAFEQGKVSDFLKKGFNTNLGNISFEFYLIHYPLIFLGWPIIVKYDLGVSRYFEWGIVFFVLSIIMAQIAHCISKKYKELLLHKK